MRNLIYRNLRNCSSLRGIDPEVPGPPISVQPPGQPNPAIGSECRRPDRAQPVCFGSKALRHRCQDLQGRHPAQPFRQHRSGESARRPSRVRRQIRPEHVVDIFAGALGCAARGRTPTTPTPAPIPCAAQSAVLGATATSRQHSSVVMAMATRRIVTEKSSFGNEEQKQTRGLC
jgi:hypothetical protein